MVTLNGLGSQNQLNVGIHFAESWLTNFSLSTNKGNTRCLEHEKQGGAQQDLYAYDFRVYTGVHGYSHHFVVCKDLQSNWPCFGFCDLLWLRSLGETPTWMQRTNQASSLMTRHDLPQIRNGGQCEWVQTLFSRAGTLPCFYKTQPSFQSRDPPQPTSWGMVHENGFRPLSQGQARCLVSAKPTKLSISWPTMTYVIRMVRVNRPRPLSQGQACCLVSAKPTKLSISWPTTTYIMKNGPCERVQTSFSRAGLLPHLRKTQPSLQSRDPPRPASLGMVCVNSLDLFLRGRPCLYKTQPSFQSRDPPWPTSLGMVRVNRPRPLSQGQACCSASCWFSQSEFHWETQFLHEQLLPNPVPQSS